jgi:hypothetical protein
MYSIRPIHWNIKSSQASPGRCRVGPASYVFSLLASTTGTRFRKQEWIWWNQAVSVISAKFCMLFFRENKDYKRINLQ